MVTILDPGLFALDKFLVFGHRSLIKNITQTAVIYIYIYIYRYRYRYNMLVIQEMQPALNVSVNFSSEKLLLY